VNAGKPGRIFFAGSTTKKGQSVSVHHFREMMNRHRLSSQGNDEPTPIIFP
jgi:hypothetical protein